MLQAVDWNTISNKYKRGSLLLGNGASVAVHSGFLYNSLYQAARRRKLLTKDVAKIFKKFKSKDFEYVLRLLWQAWQVNQILGITGHSKKIWESYERVQDALIKTIQGTHVKYDDAKGKLPAIRDFMSNFDTVISLNYDLIVYWAAMLDDTSIPPAAFKDGFVKNAFPDDWRWLRNNNGNVRSTTMFFYPHGNLVLLRDLQETERKIQTVRQGLLHKDLLEAIFDKWKSGAGTPLFVCEGTSDLKMSTIYNSRYLSNVYREVLPGIGESLVIYGWGMAEQEAHILKQIEKARLKHIAVSVFCGASPHDQLDYMFEIEKRLRGKYTQSLDFFVSNSSGCWCY